LADRLLGDHVLAAELLQLAGDADEVEIPGGDGFLKHLEPADEEYSQEQKPA